MEVDAVAAVEPRARRPAQDDDCSYDVRFRHGHVQLRVPCEHCRKKAWVGVLKENDGVSRSLMAANPLTEKNDASVRWYEKLLLWEQGKLEAAPSPDFEEGGNPLALLEAMALAEDADEDEAPRPDNTDAEALVASSTKPESASYQRFWD